jgi:hypothetical protein
LPQAKNGNLGVGTGVFGTGMCWLAGWVLAVLNFAAGCVVVLFWVCF